jgi:hypothetical protein
MPAGTWCRRQPCNAWQRSSYVCRSVVCCSSRRTTRTKLVQSN